jgi:RNA polymerase sigma factor (sigma-70 family)
MAASQMHRVVQHLRRAVLLQEGAGLTDGQLLECFIEHRDETAFAVLVRRHGPMVWGVCRRVLGNHQDAEDAFQATFLVLVRKAASVQPREMVANWLYGVARQTSLKARALAAKRRARERQVPIMAEPKSGPPDLWSDLQPLLDQELSRLPDKYRIAIVLCDLEGKTRKEAARQLRLPEGTLSARLTRGRVLLAKRLAQHGLQVSVGALAALISQNAASANVPISMVTSTIKVASLVAAGPAATAGLISAPVAALTEGVIRTMLLSKLKIAGALLLALALSGAGSLFYQTQTAARAEARSENFSPAPDASDEGQKSKDRVREAAIKALEEFAASNEEADRELAIKALVEFGKNIRRQDKHPQSESVAAWFKHRVPFEIGYTEFKEGGHIEITEVLGTQPRIRIGGQYLVRGKYRLPSHDRGKLYFWQTATEAQYASGPNLDLQYTDARKGQGEFSLLHAMQGAGYFHLCLLAEDGTTVANVYFGTDDNVLRHKP